MQRFKTSAFFEWRFRPRKNTVNVALKEKYALCFRLVSCPSFPRKSREEIIRNHLQRNSIQHDEFDVVDGPPSQVFNKSVSKAHYKKSMLSFVRGLESRD